MRILAAGLEASLVEVESLDQMLSLYQGLQEARDSGRARGITELIPAARTVLVEFDPNDTSAQEVERLIHTISLDASRPTVSDVLTINATYDGPDLAFVCDQMQMSVPQFIAWHTNVQWTVAFTGFVPGFGYLVSKVHTVSIPRLSTPRVKAPAGSIAMADRFTGIYPHESPGGWRIVGRTDELLFDIAHDPATPLLPGRTIQFDESR